MNFSYIPSLQHMAAVRISLCLYYDKDIENMLEILHQIPFETKYFPRKKIEHWELIKRKAADKLPTLPNLLRTRVTKFIRPINNEAVTWLEDHDHLEASCDFVDSSLFLDYKRILCWKTDGTIDRTQTAKKFVRCKSFDSGARFAMACTYFLEDEVLALWHGDEVLDLESFISFYGENSAMRFWLKRLKDPSLRQVPWKAAVDGYFTNTRLKFCDISLRFSCFFPYLSWEGKKSYFDDLGKYWGHRDDLYVCLRELTEKERLEAYSVFPESILVWYWQWPLQSLFIDVAKLLQTHLGVRNFKKILFHMIYDKILECLDDADYVGLLKEFWHLVPAAYKKELKEHKNFKLIEAILNYDEKNASLSLPETLLELLDESTKSYEMP